MKLFSKTGEELDLSNFKYLTEGEDGKIYVDGKTVLKLYHFYLDYSRRLRRRIFDIIKDKSIPNIVRLDDYFYTNTSFFSRIFPFDAYTMDYISAENKKIIDFKKKDLIEIFKSLEQTLEILTDNRIVLHDVHPKNIIISENGITIIDIDRFYFMRLSSKKTIYKLNKLELLNCINSTILSEIKKDNPVTNFQLFTSDDNDSFFESTSHDIENEKFEKILTKK